MMMFDQARGVTVMHGGIIPTPVNVNDTWDWNGQTWTQRLLPVQTNSFHKGYFNTATGSVEMMMQFSMETWRLVSSPWDINCNNLVDIDDLVAVINSWGQCPTLPAQCPGDVDGNGVVNIDDLVLVITHWG